jgi:hypothetical protein
MNLLLGLIVPAQEGGYRLFLINKLKKLDPKAVWLFFCKNKHSLDVGYIFTSINSINLTTMYFHP